jgi:MFS family permease
MVNDTQADIAQTDTAQIQRRSLRVLSGASALSGVAVAGSIAAGGLLAARLADSEGAAGLAQTAGVLGAALLSLPLARVAMSRGRRAAFSLGFGIGALGGLVVIAASIAHSLWLLLIGCLLVGVASAATFQSRYAATDLAEFFAVASEAFFTMPEAIAALAKDYLKNPVHVAVTQVATTAERVTQHVIFSALMHFPSTFQY